jgi:hypothetical protein
MCRCACYATLCLLCSEAMGMNLDPQFVRDLTVLISASAGAGLLMAALGQPPINGYFVAGSLVGPGGLKLIKEIVQVGGRVFVAWGH